MTITHTQQSQMTSWMLFQRPPARVAASCLYDSAEWLGTWETIEVERRRRHAYIGTQAADGEQFSVLPLYEVSTSPFWTGYEVQVGIVGAFGNPIVFAGSPYSMYSKRGRVPAPLVRGAHATAMKWIESGPAEVLVAANLTDDGVRDWVEAAGPPVGKVLLERTFSCELSGDFSAHLAKLNSKVRRDVERRLRRSRERGLQVRMLDGRDAHSLVGEALPLTVSTSEKNDWPPLFDAQSLHGLLSVPGAMMAVAQFEGRLVGAFFAFRQGNELTFMCGGIDYVTLGELSTYVALMYRSTEWACEHGIRRIEWGRDNYRFKERHGLTGTELWALAYAPHPRAELRAALTRMHDELSAYIAA
ncbi:MAG: GNAT family N-acetyltransferase [Solirubrobacteraceae bacterium]